MSHGYVYVLSNKSMPGLIKIGMTTRSAESRAAALYQTGVPTPFKVECEVLTPNCKSLEAELHLALSEFRVNDSREFFRYEVFDAVELVENLQIAQVRNAVSHFAPDYRLVYEPETVRPDAVKALSEGLSVHPWALFSILSDVTPEELKPALERYRERTKKTTGGEQ